MAKFDESKVVRSKAAGTGGQFAEKHLSKGADLNAAVSRAGLTSSPGVPPEIAGGLAESGLTGSVAPYQGDNPDNPDDTYTYKSPDSDYELDFHRTENGGYEVSYEDRWDESNSFRVQMDEYTPESLAGTLEDTLYELDVAAAGQDAFHRAGSDEYELRESTVSVDAAGKVNSRMMVSGEDGDWIDMSHDHATGETSLSRYGEAVTGPEADELMEGIMGGGDARSRAAAMFDETRSGAAKSAFAPGLLRTPGAVEA